MILLLGLLFDAGRVIGQSSVVAGAKEDIAVLTADSLFGRGYRPDGAYRAARYIRNEFRAAGLSPPGDSRYFQSFPLTVDVVDDVPSLVINGDSLEAGTEFVPHGITGEGTVVSAERIVSVGMGLVLEEEGVNAYEGLDVNRAVVVIEEQIPRAVRERTSASPRELSLIARIETAVGRGAAAVLVITDRLIYSMYPHETSVPVLTVAADAIPVDLETVSVEVDMSQNRTLKTQNVIGVIEGTADRDSLLMLTAHYDHVGSWGTSLYYPGANDNASGTALLLALARHFSDHPLPYTVVCVAFSGEELGLLGSRYFAEHPPVDLSRVRFLLNFDMVASGTEGFMAVGGVDFPGMFERLTAVSDSLEIGPVGKRKNVPNSDHYPLTQRGIRAFFLYSRGGDQPYHHVNDVMRTLDWEVFENAYTLAVHFLRTL